MDSARFTFVRKNIAKKQERATEAAMSRMTNTALEIGRRVSASTQNSGRWKEASKI